MLKENMHYTCIACITIDSVMKIDKKNHPQVYLEEYKYKIKRIQMSKLINTEPKSDWELRLRRRIKIWYWINDKIRIWFWFWIRHFTLNKFYSYVFVDFEQVLFMPIFLREQLFSQALFQIHFFLGLKTHKHCNQFN